MFAKEKQELLETAFNLIFPLNGFVRLSQSDNEVNINEYQSGLNLETKMTESFNLRPTMLSKKMTHTHDLCKDSNESESNEGLTSP